MTRSSIVASLLLLALIGCQAKSSVVGKWRGKPITPGAPQSDSQKSTQELAQYLAAQMELEFKADGTVHLTALNESDLKSTGKFTVSGNQATVTMESSVLGGPVTKPEPFSFILSGDGRTLTMKGDKPEDEIMFERVPAGS